MCCVCAHLGVSLQERWVHQLSQQELPTAFHCSSAFCCRAWCGCRRAHQQLEQAAMQYTQMLKMVTLHGSMDAHAVCRADMRAQEGRVHQQWEQAAAQCSQLQGQVAALQHTLLSPEVSTQHLHQPLESRHYSPASKTAIFCNVCRSRPLQPAPATAPP